MKKPVVFCLTLFFALIFAFSTLAGDKGRGSGHKGDGGRRGGERRGGDRGHGGMRQGNRPERARSTPGNHPKSAGQKPHILKDEREKQAAPKGPGRFDKDGDGKNRGSKSDKRGHFDRRAHHHYHHHNWYRSHWSVGVWSNGWSLYYGPWDPVLRCRPYYCARPLYYPAGWISFNYYYYRYGPSLVCDVHGYCHEGRCEWYYNDDGAMILLFYP